VFDFGQPFALLALGGIGGEHVHRLADQPVEFTGVEMVEGAAVAEPPTKGGLEDQRLAAGRPR